MNKWLRRILKGLAILVGVLVVLVIGLVGYVQIFADRPLERPVRQMAAPKDAQTVARGEFLYKSSNLCWGCHGAEGSYRADEPQAGGRKFDLSNVGPGFGVFYASNVTPDVETGIGAWSDSELVRAIREGVDRRGHLILPVMPYQFAHGMSDEDALALVAYMRSLPPVPHVVPPNEPTFAYRALGALGIMKPETSLSTSVVAPPKGVTAEYGEYLAWRTSGCAECHMPRNMNTGELDFTRPLAGALAPITEEGISASASNLTPDAATGIGQWTEEQFMTAMRTGQRPDGTVMLPFMPWPSYSRWTDDDLKAVWRYLRTLPKVDHKVPPSTLTGIAVNAEGAARGEGLFDVYCRTCHGAKGAGAPLTHVALKDVARGLDPATLTGFINKGLPGTAMPGFGKTLTGDQMTDLVTFIRTW
ncbi:MAG: c-type cytochrome [Acidobacteriota bacterium]